MSERDNDRATPRPLTPTILFLLLVGGLLLAIGIWTGNNSTGRSAGPSNAPDSLVITAPADSAEAPAPLDIAFSTRAPLRLGPAGWQAHTYHIHAVIDTLQVMPGAMDIHSRGQGQFTWRLKTIEPGVHHLRLVWARADHRTIPEGASQEITVTVTPGDEQGPGKGLFR